MRFCTGRITPYRMLTSMGYGELPLIGAVGCVASAQLVKKVKLPQQEGKENYCFFLSTFDFTSVLLTKIKKCWKPRKYRVQVSAGSFWHDFFLQKEFDVGRFFVFNVFLEILIGKQKCYIYLGKNVQWAIMNLQWSAGTTKYSPPTKRNCQPTKYNCPPTKYRFTGEQNPDTTVHQPSTNHQDSSTKYKSW